MNEIEQAVLSRFEKKWKDKKVMVVEKTHPHFGSVATFVRYEKTAIGHGLVFKNDECEFFIFKPEHIKAIT